jgi:AcrR family transcriptional regulator
MSERTRTQLVEVAARLLATGGPEAVTIRSVALDAGVQAPTIYRLFGDKNGLLDAVVAHGFATYVDQKHPEPDADPVDDLRTGWHLHVGFGLANPALFRLLHTALRSADGRAAVEEGESVFRGRIQRVAAAGRLRVTERRAADLLRAAATGVIFTLIDEPEDRRDEGLPGAAWDAVAAAILVDRPAAQATGPAAAAVTLQAALPDLQSFSTGERELLGEWLHRVSEPGPREAAPRDLEPVISGAPLGVSRRR